jgi:hypothetical protein
MNVDQIEFPSNSRKPGNIEANDFIAIAHDDKLGIFMSDGLKVCLEIGDECCSGFLMTIQKEEGCCLLLIGSVRARDCFVNDLI